MERQKCVESQLLTYRGLFGLGRVVVKGTARDDLMTAWWEMR